MCCVCVCVCAYVHVCVCACVYVWWGKEGLDKVSYQNQECLFRNQVICVNSPLNFGCTIDILNYFLVYIELEDFF